MAVSAGAGNVQPNLRTNVSELSKGTGRCKCVWPCKGKDPYSILALKRAYGNDAELVEKSWIKEWGDRELIPINTGFRYAKGFLIRSIWLNFLKWEFRYKWDSCNWRFLNIHFLGDYLRFGKWECFWILERANLNDRESNFSMCYHWLQSCSLRKNATW